jgi:hypothetical protein
MKWNIRAKNWDDFPPGQRWFAVGEALSHLNYLIDQGKVQKIEKGGVHIYFPDSKADKKIHKSVLKQNATMLL